MKELKDGDVEFVNAHVSCSFVCICGKAEILIETDVSQCACEECGRIYKFKGVIYVNDKQKVAA